MKKGGEPFKREKKIEGKEKNKKKELGKSFDLASANWWDLPHTW